jgi:hypothetical protein
LTLFGFHQVKSKSVGFNWLETVHQDNKLPDTTFVRLANIRGIMETSTTDLSWLCIVIIFGITAVVIILGTRSRLRYAHRIRDAQARGAFADMNTSENKSRVRRLAALALIGSLGMISSIISLVLLRGNQPGTFSGVLVAGVIIFGIIASIAGFLIQREIDRRI